MTQSDPRHGPPGEIFRALAVLAEPPTGEHAAIAAALGLGAPPPAAEHTDLFELQFFPYGSVHLGSEGMRGGEAMDRVAGFWRALELEPPRDPDHLTVLVAAYGGLLDRAELATTTGAAAAAAHWRHVCQAFLHEHVLSWLPLFLIRLEAAGDGFHGGFYGAWARQLRSVLAGETIDDQLANTLPAALREAERLPDPREEGGEAFLDGLLVPVRTGFILTRDDLAAMAGEAGLGRRIGERRYVLRGLFSQDASAVLRALARLARDGADAVEHSGMPPATLGWWRSRATASAELLARLAEDAAALEPEGSSGEE